MTLEYRDGSTGWFTLESLGWEDESMHSVRVQAGTHWFRVDFTESLIFPETDDWAEGLRQMHRDMAGSYVFRSLHGWLQVTYVMGKRGELHVSIQLQNYPDFLNEVRFFLNLDQTYLPKMAAEIEEFGRRTL